MAMPAASLPLDSEILNRLFVIALIEDDLILEFSLVKTPSMPHMILFYSLISLLIAANWSAKRPKKNIKIEEIKSRIVASVILRGLKNMSYNPKIKAPTNITRLTGRKTLRGENSIMILIINKSILKASFG